MANALYPKLALTNLGKNKSTYFPYMLTSIVCIMTYYIMQSIAMNEGLMEVPGAAIAMTIFFLGTGIIAVFCIALMLHQQLSHQAAQKGTRPLLCTGHGKAARCAGFVF